MYAPSAEAETVTTATLKGQSDVPEDNPLNAVRAVEPTESRSGRCCSDTAPRWFICFGTGSSCVKTEEFVPLIKAVSTQLLSNLLRLPLCRRVVHVNSPRSVKSGCSSRFVAACVKESGGDVCSSLLLQAPPTGIQTALQAAGVWRPRLWVFRLVAAFRTRRKTLEAMRVVAARWCL